MAKAKKGSVIPSILLVVGIVVQIASIGMVYIFLQDSKEVQKIKEVQEAKESAEWAVPIENLSATEETITENYIANSKQTVRSYWHSDDRYFRLSVKSPALKELMARRLLVVREGQAGDHLVLTIYYNPLRLKTPTSDDLVPLYRVVRYKKPEIAMLYENQSVEEDVMNEEVEVEEDIIDEDQEANESTSDSSTSEDSEQALVKEEKPLITEDDIHYPFDELQVLVDEYEYVIYKENFYTPDAIILNKEYIQPYLSEDSFHGDYGWERGVFYWDLEDYKPEEGSEEKSEETESDESAESDTDSKDE